MANEPIALPPEIQAAISKTVEQQAAQDAVGLKAATTALPGPLRDVFAPAPDLKVNEQFTVRRFVDRDFVFLAALGHPLNRFTAMADGSYKFEPSGELAWQLCWLLTRPVADIKAAFKAGGAENVKELAADVFGELGIHAISKVMETIARQMTIYASAHLEYEPVSTEGENRNPPS
jgi:hypothetical protein